MGQAGSTEPFTVRRIGFKQFSIVDQAAVTLHLEMLAFSGVPRVRSDHLRGCRTIFLSDGNRPAIPQGLMQRWVRSHTMHRRRGGTGCGECGVGRILWLIETMGAPHSGSAGGA